MFSVDSRSYFMETKYISCLASLGILIIILNDCLFSLRLCFLRFFSSQVIGTWWYWLVGGRGQSAAWKHSVSRGLVNGKLCCRVVAGA